MTRYGISPRSAHPEIAGAHRDQQRSLDPGAVHLAEVILGRHPAEHLGRHPHLTLEVVVEPGPAVGDRFGRIDVADDVDVTGQTGILS